MSNQNKFSEEENLEIEAISLALAVLMKSDYVKKVELIPHNKFIDQITKASDLVQDIMDADKEEETEEVEDVDDKEIDYASLITDDVLLVVADNLANNDCTKVPPMPIQIAKEMSRLLLDLKQRNSILESIAGL